MKRKFLTVFAILILLIALVPAMTVGADKPIKDVSPKHDSPNYNKGMALPFSDGEKLKGQPPIGPAKVGQSRIWLALNDYTGSIYLKYYTLRAVGQHIEVWVANNLNFPAGDCRNDGIRNVITDDQVSYLISEFDNNMYPKEADWWSTPPERDGKNSILPKIFNGKKGKDGLNIPDSTYNGEGDNIVVLVDNVRDDNYYDTDNANTFSYIAGFYYSTFDEYFDRTVMSIDAWDWIHRTGADPLHQPSGNPCSSAPARPNLYESVFAHEYQHLLHHYTDPDEPSWVNEGMSDFTEIITGYAHLDRHVDEKGYESHTQSYLGWNQVTEANWNPIPYVAGAENSLTAWGDQGDGEILADYGNAMYFMNYVYSQPGLGKDFFHAWQHNPANGIEGLNDTLATFGVATDFETLFNDDIISALVDGYIDNGATVGGGTAAQFQNTATEATIMLNDQANGTTGAPPWGADYIDLGDGSSLASLVFDGQDQVTFAGGPQWVVGVDGYWTNPDVSGQAYYDNDQDLSIAHQITVTGAGNLTFEHYYAIELGWDFGFVQISDDNGSTWTSLACTGTTNTADPGAFSYITQNLPGYTGPTGDNFSTTTNGTAGAPLAASCDLSAWSGGDPILLAFRLMTDEAYQQDGWHIRNLKLDGVAVDASPDDLSDWNNIQYYSPVPLYFGFALVGIDGGVVDMYGDVTAGTSVHVIRPTLGTDNTYTASGDDLPALSSYDKVVAVIWGIPASEDSALYQPYSLLVNGSEKADGQ